MSTTEKPKKPLGRRAYGSIGHLPNSRLGPADHCVDPGMARICCHKARDKHDRIIVQEKLDGSCVAVAKINGEAIPLGRAGYRAETSPYEQHWLFADWVRQNADRFLACLDEGERLVGEWIAQAHGTRYYGVGTDPEPFIAFDIMEGQRRYTYDLFMSSLRPGKFHTARTLHRGEPLSIEHAMALHDHMRRDCDELEGVVYRVEREGRVDFLAKWVHPEKIDGKYLPEVSGKPAVWNWRP